jgi:hypothetical protein
MTCGAGTQAAAADQQACEASGWTADTSSNSRRSSRPAGRQTLQKLRERVQLLLLLPIGSCVSAVVVSSASERAVQPGNASTAAVGCAYYSSCSSSTSAQLGLWDLCRVAV